MAEETNVLMLQALKACRAWHDAEREGLGDFWLRSDLCAYSEWITRKAIAVAEGEPFDEPFMGPPSLIVWPTCELQRTPEHVAAQMVAAVESAVLSRVSPSETETDGIAKAATGVSGD